MLTKHNNALQLQTEGIISPTNCKRLECKRNGRKNTVLHKSVKNSRVHKQSQLNEFKANRAANRRG